MLKFSEANAKTHRLAEIESLQPYLQNQRKVYSLDLPAGYSCPGAKDCMSKCVLGRIVDGPNCRFRCFSASQEVVYPNVHKARMHNLELIKRGSTESTIHFLLYNSLPKDAGIVRYHVSGDFFSINYLRAAYALACIRKDVLFYGYTKSIHLLRKIDCQDMSQGIVLPNFLLTASLGGKYDDLAVNMEMRTANVVFDESDTELPIDHDDSNAATVGGSFSLLLHGVQPAKTQAAKAWQKIRTSKGGYSRSRNLLMI